MQVAYSEAKGQLLILVGSTKTVTDEAVQTLCAEIKTKD